MSGFYERVTAVCIMATVVACCVVTPLGHAPLGCFVLHARRLSGVRGVCAGEILGESVRNREFIKQQRIERGEAPAPGSRHC